MPIREVKIYTCDGCGATATLDRNATARGWHTVKLDGRSAQSVLCSVCYGAVEWVTRFQGITVPPKAHKGPDGRYRLRQVTAAELPPLVPDEDEEDDLFEEDEED
ncbi:hypothetical protein SEA_TINYMAN4_56 [Microbacterium phage Tinyman4]|nr:hypothetical protein SEA_TINYMAN4_56 [Microbacterium phage Tinyman4]